MKSTLWCNCHVSKSVHRDTAVARAGPWTEEWWPVISDPFWPRWWSLMFRLQWKRTWWASRVAHTNRHDYTCGAQNQQFFLTMNTMNKWMNENLWNDMKRRRLKSDGCWWDEIGQTGEFREILQNLDVSHHNCPLATPRLAFGTPEVLDELSNLSCAGMDTTIVYFHSYGG